MRFIAAFVLSLVLAATALAVGPQDMTLTFQTRAGGGAAQGHRLYVNDVLKGTVTSGQTVTAAVSGITGNGSWKICVNAFNATGETAGGNCKTAVVSDLAPAPTDVITVTMQCQMVTPSTCTVVLQ